MMPLADGAELFCFESKTSMPRVAGLNLNPQFWKISPGLA
jgi:hypothetical protein